MAGELTAALLHHLSRKPCGKLTTMGAKRNYIRQAAACGSLFKTRLHRITPGGKKRGAPRAQPGCSQSSHNQIIITCSDIENAV